jgi:hypothetical protein
VEGARQQAGLAQVRGTGHVACRAGPSGFRT